VFSTVLNSDVPKCLKVAGSRFAVPGEKQKDSVSIVQRRVPGPALRSPANYKRITLQIILSLFQLAGVHGRRFVRRIKKVFRFEETPLIHGQELT
jgi:hypothetical protein